MRRLALRHVQASWTPSVRRITLTEIDYDGFIKLYGGMKGGGEMEQARQHLLNGLVGLFVWFPQAPGLRFYEANHGPGCSFWALFSALA